MIQYVYELWQDVLDALRQMRILIVVACTFLLGVALGIVSVDSGVVIVDTASGEYILLLVSSGSAVTVFLRLFIDALVLVIILWLLSLGNITNYFKIMLVLYLGYNLGVCIVVTALICGFVTTIVVVIIYTLYILMLVLATLMSYCSCRGVYGCRCGRGWQMAIFNNKQSILVIILAILAMILLNFIIIRPICSVI